MLKVTFFFKKRWKQTNIMDKIGQITMETKVMKNTQKHHWTWNNLEDIDRKSLCKRWPKCWRPYYTILLRRKLFTMYTELQKSIIKKNTSKKKKVQLRNCRYVCLSNKYLQGSPVPADISTALGVNRTATGRPRVERCRAIQPKPWIQCLRLDPEDWLKKWGWGM